MIIKNKKFKAKLPKPNVSPMKEYKKNPGSLNAAAFAAHFKAKQLKTDIVVIEGNSMGHRVYHLATPDEDLKKYTAMSTKANVLVVNQKGEAFEAIAESKKTTFKELYLAEKVKLKKVHPGRYEAKVGNIEIDVYKAEFGDYWSSTILVGKYGDDDYEEESIQAETKRDLMKSIEKFVREH